MEAVRGAALSARTLDVILKAKKDGEGTGSDRLLRPWLTSTTSRRWLRSNARIWGRTSRRRPTKGCRDGPSMTSHHPGSAPARRPCIRVVRVRNVMLQSLKTYVRSERRVCPMPQRWKELWEMLPERRRVGGGWEPPLPLILDGWWHTSAQEKMLRLQQHLEYAAAHGVLEEVDAFLRALPEAEWAHLGEV